MTVKFSPWGNSQFVDSTGAPASGYKIYTYTAGSSSALTTYTDSTGSTPQTNPIILNTMGLPTTGQIWLTTGLSYKLVWTDASDVVIKTEDNITGVNDASVTIDQWVASGLTTTYVGATSFTVVGDQTSAFHVGRRLKSTVSGGTAYSTIVTSAFSSVTTVTVANDSTPLDSGMSAVSYGLITAVNPSIDADMVNRKGAAVASATTTDIWSIAGDYAHITGTTTITGLGTAPYAGVRRTVVFDGILTLTHNATSLILPGTANITTAAGDRMEVRADTTANMIVVSYIKASGAPVVAGVSAASQAQMEAASATDVYVSPGRTVNHPGVAKAWALFNGTGTPAYTTSYGFDTGTAITDGGTGLYTLTFSTAFSAANFAVLLTGDNTGTRANTWGYVIARTTTTVQVQFVDDQASVVDPASCYIVCFGDQ